MRILGWDVSGRKRDKGRTAAVRSGIDPGMDTDMGMDMDVDMQRERVDWGRRGRRIVVTGTFTALVLIAIIAGARSLTLAPALAQGTGEGQLPSLFSGEFGFSEEPEPGAAEAQPANQAAPLPPESPVGPDFELVASSAHLELYMNKSDSRLAVRDLRSGKIWRSSPEVGDRPLKGGSLWRQHMDSAFVVTYTDARKRGTKVTNNIREAATISWEPLESGLKARYDMPRLGIALSIEYRIGDDYLDVRIPGDEIEERSEFKLVTIEPLPFFGATFDDVDGYMLIPDGSGALTHFGRRRGEPRRAFYEPVYGHDWIAKNIYSVLTHVSMPVFGIAHSGADGREVPGSFLAIVTRGDFEARITCSPAGYITDFNRASVEFRARRQYSAPISAQVFVNTFTDDLIRGERAVRYVFQAGDKAGYPGMAAAYRNYLVKDRGLTRNADADAGAAPARLQLRIFHGITKKTGMLSRFIPMTTFDEARVILDALLDAGITGMDVTLVGWTRDGYDGAAPLRLPPDTRLGGEKGLAAFVAYAKSKGQRVFLEDNYLDAFRGNGGFSTRMDVLRGYDKLPRFIEPDNFFLTPGAAIRHASHDMPIVAKLGVDGIDIRYLGQYALSHTERRRSERRDEVTAKWLKLADLARRTFGSVGSIGGDMYVLGHVDRITDVWMEDSEYEFVDEDVPFYQMVVHGLVPYCGYPGNLRSDPDIDFLKMIEYGALPAFELTYRHSSDLRETRYNMLFSSFYKDWINVAAKEWRAVCVEMGDLQSKLMMGHRVVAPGVRETEYEDGTRVIVNYNEFDQEVDGTLVRARSYAVVRRDVATGDFRAREGGTTR